MRLEDATKEELMWWIRKNAVRLYFDERRFESDILFRRSQLAIDKSRVAGERYTAALVKYSDLLKPYEGQRIMDLPQSVITQGAKFEREMNVAAKDRDIANKEWERINRKIDLMMHKEEADHG